MMGAFGFLWDGMSDDVYGDKGSGKRRLLHWHMAIDGV